MLYDLVGLEPLRFVASIKARGAGAPFLGQGDMIDRYGASVAGAVAMKKGEYFLTNLK